MASETRCKFCGAEMGDKVTVCPVCGKKKDIRPFYKKWWFIALVLMVLVGSVMDTLENKESEKIRLDLCEDLSAKIVEPDSYKRRYGIAVHATELSSAYKNNQFAAERRFKGKIVRIVGVISAIDNEYVLSNNKTLKLHGAGKEYQNIQCHFTPEHIDGLMRVSIGDEVAVQGTVEDVAWNINVRDTQVLDKGKDNVALIYDYNFGDMLLSIDTGEYAGTRYYAQMRDIDLNPASDVVTVHLTTIPRNDFATKLSKKYKGTVTQLDRNIVIDLKENKYKCSNFVATIEAEDKTEESGDAEWHSVGDGTTMYYIIEAVRPYIEY